MSKIKLRLGSWIVAMLICGSVAAVGAQEALAFVIEVEGKATVVRQGKESEVADTGSQLFAGDALEVAEGSAELIYLSGRSAKVEAGQTHRVEEGKEPSSALVGRVMETLGEIAGPQGAGSGPVVHGMARDLAGLNGALPANCLLTHGDFSFTWDPLEEVEEYEFTLETPEGEVLATKRVESTDLAATSLALQPGKRYVWQVMETGSFLPRNSGKSWIEITATEKQEKLRKSIEEIEKLFGGDNLTMLKAAVLYEAGYHYEAERLLVGLHKKRKLSKLEQQLLMGTYAMMERWDRLPAPKEKAEQPSEPPEGE